VIVAGSQDSPTQNHGKMWSVPDWVPIPDSIPHVLFQRESEPDQAAVPVLIVGRVTAVV
jgi:hypothetical protein